MQIKKYHYNLSLVLLLAAILPLKSLFAATEQLYTKEFYASGGLVRGFDASSVGYSFSVGKFLNDKISLEAGYVSLGDYVFIPEDASGEFNFVSQFYKIGLTVKPYLDKSVKPFSLTGWSLRDLQFRPYVKAQLFYANTVEVVHRGESLIRPNDRFSSLSLGLVSDPDRDLSYYAELGTVMQNRMIGEGHFFDIGARYYFDFVKVNCGESCLYKPKASTRSSTVQNASAKNVVNGTNNTVLVFDRTKPTVKIVPEANSNPFKVTFMFSEDVYDFQATDVIVRNGALSSLIGSGSVYTAEVYVNKGKTPSISLPEGAVKDRAGNRNKRAFKNNIALDLIPPRGAMSLFASKSQSNTFQAVFSFSEPVKGFSETDIQLSNARIVNIKGAGKKYTVDLVSLEDGFMTIGFAPRSVTDLAGNFNQFNLQKVVLVDSTEPQVEIVIAGNLKVTNELEVVFSFSESVRGFQARDVVVDNGEITNFSGSNAAYRAKLVVYDTTKVTRLTVKKGAVVDKIGNTNSAYEKEIFIDIISPKVTVSVDQDYTNSTAIPISFIFSEEVTGFTARDVVVSNGRIIKFKGSGSEYTAVLRPQSDGSVDVYVPSGVAEDRSGNLNEGSRPGDVAPASQANTARTVTPVTKVKAAAVLAIPSNDANALDEETVGDGFMADASSIDCSTKSYLQVGVFLKGTKSSKRVKSFLQSNQIPFAVKEFKFSGKEAQVFIAGGFTTQESFRSVQQDIAKSLKIQDTFDYCKLNQ